MRAQCVHNIVFVRSSIVKRFRFIFFHFSTAIASDGAKAEPGADTPRRARQAEPDEGGRPRVGAQGQPEDARSARTPQHETRRRGKPNFRFF